METLESIIAWDSHGLIPCITQDYLTNKVLMLAYMNRESLSLSIETHIAHYFSRSKQRIWKKGETSGNIQEIQEISFDCDNDTMLLKVVQKGYACHTGETSCFFKVIPIAQHILNNSIQSYRQYNKTNHLQNQNENITQSLKMYGVLDTLYHILLDRKNADSNKSYTASLFAKGENTIAKKIIEEAGEFCFAFKDKNTCEIVYECADVFYHMFVALASMKIHPDRIYQELERRMGTSGVDEKKSRAQNTILSSKQHNQE
ncbi:bifunctional phosphoribosyl-AMP cyclohydrolase/phosphoribosyl-ATP pyrophosphatase [Helicobacter didelphidarum]|uniref:Histidine biosynthesis bifunctional protein HisIE n=1 Tax=Helicobacter didelphidarum TaxID=2040648 RepID=A0A3D8IST3_9HELI|nr:bifunctional phosphoribosyl-AMP cyclohydrolase/phosphoribosyl-ATP pyrophosphatase [Helicobacter didelphidarum]